MDLQLATVAGSGINLTDGEAAAKLAACSFAQALTQLSQSLAFGGGSVDRAGVGQEPGKEGCDRHQMSCPE